MRSTKIGVSLSPHKSKFGPILFAGNLQKGLETAHELGYEGVEISLLDSQRVDKKWLIQKLESLDLQVFAIATGQTFYIDGYSIYHSDPLKRRLAVERVRGHIDLAAVLGAKVILGGIRGTIEESNINNLSSLTRKGRDAIANCVEYAESNNVVLLLEPVNRYETNIFNTIEEGLDFIKQIGSSNLMLLPDTFHMNIEEPSMVESLGLAGSKIGYIHFADSNRWAPGLGHIDFRSIFSALVKVGYSGPVGVEVLPKPDDLTAARRAILHIKSIVQEVET
jgi:sugar phosphate isomerase/epimerase